METPHLDDLPRIAERAAVDADTFARDIALGYAPVVLRGQVAHWPAVAAGRSDAKAIADYLATRGDAAPLEVMIAAPDHGGRFFYNDDLSGLNFQRETVGLPMLLAELLRLGERSGPTPALYAGAAIAQRHLPGFEEDNPLNLPVGKANARLWIGNATRIATHYDTSTNLACVVAGRRRFTLFPPQQARNLYVGPFDRTPAGPPVSMVDLEAPDLDRYPRFADALAHAQVADLGPGDAIFIPAIWWHHVRADGSLNVLANYWWRDAPGGQPFLALIHALMSVRDLPPAEKAAWRDWFDHYVFADDAEHAADHLAPQLRGALGEASDARTEMIRGYLAASLARRG